jgi:glycosyltransferase involved in cell wall biosynthesis
VYEAAACRRPIVSTNDAFRPLLGGLTLDLLAAPRDPAALAARIGELAAASSGARAATGEELRSRVVRHHSLDHWADEVLRLVTEVRSPRGTAGSRRSE